MSSTVDTLIADVHKRPLLTTKEFDALKFESPVREDQPSEEKEPKRCHWREEEEESSEDGSSEGEEDSSEEDSKIAALKRHWREDSKDSEKSAAPAPAPKRRKDVIFTLSTTTKDGAIESQLRCANLPDNHSDGVNMIRAAAEMYKHLFDSGAFNAAISCVFNATSKKCELTTPPSL